jgi:hypothetical protein
MPAQDLIDVRIIVDGQPLQEYMEPEAIDEGSKRVRYVEVKAGQEFAVQVTWKAGFDFMWTEALTCRLWIDDLDFCTGDELEKRNIRHRHGKLLCDVSKITKVLMLKNDITAEWESCPYTFGVLGMSE